MLTAREEPSEWATDSKMECEDGELDVLYLAIMTMVQVDHLPEGSTSNRVFAVKSRLSVLNFVIRYRQSVFSFYALQKYTTTYIKLPCNGALALRGSS